MTSSSRGTRQKNFFGTCSTCKTNYSCCRETLPPITKRRKKIVEEYIKKQQIKMKDPFLEGAYTHPKIDADGYCVFHDRTTHKCIIHAVKPETCVSGPITFDINRKTAKIEWFIKMEKICPLAGIVYSDNSLLTRHLGSAKREIARLIRGLSSEALKDVLTKDEPETFKIDEDITEDELMKRLL